MSLPAGLSEQAHHFQSRAAAYAGAGDLLQAVVHFEKALRLSPDLLEARHELGNVYHRLGEWQQAADCFRQVLSIWPACVAALNNLGNVLREQGRLTEAIAVYQEALRLAPEDSDFAYHLGIAYHESEDLNQAMPWYRRALQTNPLHANASSNLATALKEQGLFGDAVLQFRQTLRLKADHALAYYNLSELAAEGRFSFSPEELGRLRNYLARDAHTPIEQSLFSFTLAAVLNKQGAYDEAFSFYRRANELRANLLKDQGAAFDPAAHRALVDRISALYEQKVFRETAGWGAESEMPVFIIGMPRCGSTLVEQILASHSQVYGAGELGEIPRYVASLAAGTSGPYTSALPVDKRHSQELAARYLGRIAHLGRGASRVTIKTLENFLHLGLIATLFPRARIVHCRRDPLDVCLSCYFQNFQDLPFSWRLQDIGTYHVAYERLMTHWAKVLPLRIHEVHYQELVQKPQNTIKNLVGFCGLEWEESCLNFFDNPRTVRTASTVQVRKPISASAIGRWRRYRRHLGPLFTALGPTIASPTLWPTSGVTQPLPQSS